MSAIKDFFKKKKADAKFKLAGAGQKLSDPSGGSGGRGGGRGQVAGQQERQHPSQSSQQAGAAALNRLAGKETKEADLVRARQKAMIRDKARQELEREQQIDAEIAKIKSVYGEKAEIECEGPQHLAVSGVFFKCDLIGGEPGTREQIKQRIKEFLYNQLESERCLTAVLIIHTCNSPRDRVELCVDTLCKYLDNIVNNPTETKFRKIRKSNRAFNERVAALDGTREFLEGCGFEIRQMEGPDGAMEDFWYYAEENSDIETLAAMRDTLKGAEPVAAELDRGLKVIPPSQKISRELPPDFFNLTKEELKAEQESKRDQLERESMLRTKAMRDKEEAKAKRKYKYCLIRIRFPDGWILQGTFSVYETVGAVMEFLTEQLAMPLPYILVDSATGAKLGQGEEVEQTLVDLGLVPASLLNFCWDPEIERDMASQGADTSVFLKPELKQ